MRIRVSLAACGLILAVSCEMAAQSASSLAPDMRQYVKVDAPVIALTHVRVIDGTGAPARADQTVIIEEGKIQAVGDAATVSVPRKAKVLNVPGETVIPGLVMMHEHLFYAAGLARNLDGSIAQPIMIKELGFSFPRLYLAAGVTFLRTAGSLEPYADLNIKQMIDAGKMPGPKIDVTGPYLEGPHSFFAQMHQLTGPDDARRPEVTPWSAQ